MNEQPKSKVLIIIIGVLLAANVIMLAFFLMNDRKALKKEKTDRNVFVSNYLKKEVGFDTHQLADYDSLSKKHREQLKATFSRLNEERKKTFQKLAATSFSDIAIDSAAMEIHERQRVLELSMLKHLRDIRKLCTPEQLPRFDTGFYKIFGRRGESRK